MKEKGLITAGAILLLAAGLHAQGVITTVAGNGTLGFSGDGGPATSASLHHFGVAVDGAGNLFIADTQNNRIRKVDSSGIISTVAGDGTQGFAGDGGPATNAWLNKPHGVTVDDAGNLFISDSRNQRIRKVDTTGTITTVAGTGAQGFGGDGGPATNASLNLPLRTALDSAGNLYIADRSNVRIRKVDTAGNITTVAGNGTFGFSGDGGLATNASLSFPHGLVLDTNDNLFIADLNNHRIRKVDPAGIITTVAGNGAQGFAGDGGPAISASLYQPHQVALDSSGNLFIADALNHRVRKVDTTGTITTVAGSGATSFSGDGGPATNAGMDAVHGLAVDSADNLFIGSNPRVRQVVFVVTVTIDIKPGSDPNSINLGSAGVIPVAILSSATFDATTVDPETLFLAGAAVKMAGKSGKFKCHTEDVDGDLLPDIVCQVETAQFMITVGQGTAEMTAETTNGISIRGVDSINIVP